MYSGNYINWYYGPTRVTTRWLLRMVGWLTIGVAWQGFAVWLLINPVLQESGRLWVIMAAWAVAIRVSSNTR